MLRLLCNAAVVGSDLKRSGDVIVFDFGCKLVVRQKAYHVQCEGRIKGWVCFGGLFKKESVTWSDFASDWLTGWFIRVSFTKDSVAVYSKTNRANDYQGFVERAECDIFSFGNYQHGGNHVHKAQWLKLRRKLKTFTKDGNEAATIRKERTHY